MPTAITHAVVAVAAGSVCFRPRPPVRFWLLAIACSAGPDLDVLLHRFGVRYEDAWGHRGITHSLPFALLAAVLVVTLAFRREAPFPSPRWWRWTAFFFALTASHGLLDTLTDGGLGIALLAPFDGARFFAPWRPVAVAPISIPAFFSRWGAEVMVSEIIWIWGPVVALTSALHTARWIRRRDERAAMSDER